ncbi:U32 family peptidase [Natronosporangium hydrolyticum]|uniref:U32 family peptidase n=1 Tax=Natronosporangium hydrolyticum TaxID=2811111 RepID=A0A895YGB7_9ACTN|nr:U32 family peptidase [Natronosporangium hydrolyticum]QSB12728.1 U32 family peptidase [Natronosporangium hydrolyticum]
MTTSAIDALLTDLDLPATDAHALPASPLRFPDGAAYRVEIPSVEGPRCLETVLAEARRYEVPVTRVSQGTGVGLLTDAEISEMVAMAAAAGVELCLFARPSAGWDTSAMAVAPAGGGLAACVRGADQLAAAVDEIRRAAELGVRSVLIADLGLLSVFGQLRAAGELPAQMQAKVSVMLSVANPATARVIAGLGADTINLPTDLSIAQIGAIRAAVPTTLDVYVEAPDNLGGFVRHYEQPRLVRVAAPVYLKFGLRNAPDIYPSGSHLEATAVALSAERVRRARLGLDLLRRAGVDADCSVAGADGLALPVPAT